MTRGGAETEMVPGDVKDVGDETSDHQDESQDTAEPRIRIYSGEGDLRRHQGNKQGQNRSISSYCCPARPNKCEPS
jgi:hypothetical protein